MADGKETNILQKYDYSAFIPTTGKNRVACEYDVNDKKQAINVFVNGKELPKDIEADKKKQERIAKRKAAEEAEVIRKEEARKNATERVKFRTDSFNISEEEAQNGVTQFCPKDTKELKIAAYQVENFALKLNKFARFCRK